MRKPSRKALVVAGLCVLAMASPVAIITAMNLGIDMVISPQLGPIAHSGLGGIATLAVLTPLALWAAWVNWNR